MISKKDALTLGILAVGGVAVASTFAGGDDGGEGGAVMEGLRGVKGRAGGILGGATPPTTTPTVYQFAAQPAVKFPAAPTFDISSLLAPTEAPITRGAAGVSSAGKKRVVYGGYKPSGKTYVFGGGEFESQAVEEVVSQGYSPTLAAAFGISPEIASGDVKKGGWQGTGMTQSEYASMYKHRTTSVRPGGVSAKKTPTDAQKAISHAKRLRAGRGD